MMKQQLLKLSLLLVSLLTGANGVWAQSEFTFVSTQWTCDVGSISTDGGKITTTGYNWGCAEIQNNTAFKVKTTGRYLVLTGTNIYGGTSNPCIKNFNGSDQDYKPKLTVNEAKTKAYIDMSGYYNDLTADGDYYTISSIGLFLQEPTKTDGGNYDAATVITNIEFTAKAPVDPIDYTFDATKWTCGVGSISTEEGKITSSAYNWGCFELKNETAYKVKKSDAVYLKLTGANIYAGSNNPCLNMLGDEIAAKPKLYVNSDNTEAYVNISGYTSALETDGDYYIVSGIQFYMEEPTKTDGVNYDAATVITKIEFVDAIDITYTLVVGEAKAATLVLPFDAALPTGVKAYTLTYTGGDKVTATEVTEQLSANKPVLINADAGIYAFTSKAGTFAFSGEASNGALNGSYYTKTVPVDSYILKKTVSGVGFAKVTSSSGTVKVNAHHAYLTATSPARSLDIDYGGTTGITQMEDVRSEKADVYYDLQGHRVLNPTKGLYIVKGKKVIVK